MKRLTLLFVYLFCLCTPVSVLAGSEFIAVAYHDVVDHRNELTYDAVTLDNLIDHFEWIKANDYHPVSIDDLKAARAGTKPLPERPVLLCWDDGYTSFYTHVFPLLKAYRFPAVLALVGSWMAPGYDKMVQYGNRQISRDKFMTWKQIREVSSSGLVEIASHSNDLHTAVLADQFGDTLPATITHRYDPATGTYETDPQFERRIREDLQASSDQILQHLGFRPRVLVWPFGRYNMAALEIAAEIGMSITLTLDPVPADVGQLQVIGRIYPTRNPDLRTFRSYLEARIRPPVKHFFRVDSQDLLEPLMSEEQHFNVFLDRVKELDPNMVVLDPVVGDNDTRRALFVNSRFPIAQDRLNRISWHTTKRAEAGVFLWLSSFLFAPGVGETAETVKQFFSDLGKSAPGEGLVVENPDVVQALFQLVENDSGQKTEVRFWNPDKRRRARQAIIENGESAKVLEVFQALEAFQQWQPFQEVSLVLSVNDFRTAELEQFHDLLTVFDFLIVDVGGNSIGALKNSLGPQLKVLQDAGYLRKCAFLLSAEDRSDNLASDLHRLPTLNVISWGYQFDRFLEGSPSSVTIRPMLSKKTFPYPLRY